MSDQKDLHTNSFSDAQLSSYIISLWGRFHLPTVNSLEGELNLHERWKVEHFSLVV